ncbi:MAG: peptidase, partial [Mucilaginibacter sp.]|nr:peptidase [Mucilaginibacter sp.]
MKDKKLEKPKPLRKISNKKITPKPPKFNVMWLYAVVIATFIGVAYFSGNNGGAQIDFKRFETEMLNQHDVDYLVAYKSGDLVVAEVHLKKDSLKKPQYADINKTQHAFGVSPDDPQYSFTAASFESLQQAVNNAEKNIPDP